jgi:membrane protein implicated in regulation of membrane protease activity
MIMQAWQIWMLIGILCVVIEIFDPAFFFLSLGIAAILTGLMSWFIQSTPVALQIVIFVIFSFIAFLSMRKLGKKLLANPGSETNIFALKGKPGVVIKTIPPEAKGYVKIESEEWSAISENNLEISEGTKITVTGIEGNKLIVQVRQES